jgi:hypothetical protein
MIYSYVLGGHDFIVLEEYIPTKWHRNSNLIATPAHHRCRFSFLTSTEPKRPLWRWYVPRLPLALLESNRQVHSETRLLPFELSTFTTEHIATFLKFSKGLQAEKANAITSVVWRIQRIRGVKELSTWAGKRFKQHVTTLESLVEPIAKALPGLKHLSIEDSSENWIISTFQR